MVFDPISAISLGGTALSVGSSLFGRKSSGTSSNPFLDFMIMSMTTSIAKQENAARQRQMNLDANRRKRDIIRQAQVAAANAEAVAFNQGAGRSSVLEGARGSISGQAGVNILGVEQNREIGNELFGLNEQRANILQLQRIQQIQQQSSSSSSSGFLGGLGTLGGAVASEASSIGKLGQWGWGQFSSSISSV